MQNIKISNPTHILPARPPFTHDHVLSLSRLDTEPNNFVTFRYLRVYANTVKTTAADPFQVISTALSAALVHYYPLAGSLCRRDHENHRLVVFCTVGQGIPLVPASADCTLESVNYLDDPHTHFVEQLVPDPDQEEGMRHPCILQVTHFECGGYCLGAAIHHSLCDGLGATQFFNAVAELARGASRVSFDPVWEREKVLGPCVDPPRVEGPLVRKFLNLDPSLSPDREEMGQIQRECFHVRDELLESFKTFLLEQSGFKFTTFEALGAYIWRSKVKAAGFEGTEKVKFAYSVNIRKLIKPPLPVGYWGNGCIAMHVELSAKDIIEKPIWETAELIKKSKNNVTDECVRSFQEVHYGDQGIITAGKRVSGFTDWRHLGHSTLDFGWGAPVTVLPLSRNLLGSVEPCFFLPYSKANAERKDDGFKVLVNLDEAAMPAFKRDMEAFTGT